MTPKEKAIELYNKYLDGFNFDSTYRNCYEQSKQCALIAVDEIFEETRDYCEDNYHQDRMNYWQEVKQEIEKL